MNFMYLANIVVDSIRAVAFGIFILTIPVNFRVNGMEYNFTPTVIDAYVNVLDISVRNKRSKEVILPVPVRSKDIRQYILRAVIYTNSIERAFITKGIYSGNSKTTGNRVKAIMNIKGV